MDTIKCAQLNKAGGAIAGCHFKQQGEQRQILAVLRSGLPQDTVEQAERTIAVSIREDRPSCAWIAVPLSWGRRQTNKTKR